MSSSESSTVGLVERVQHFVSENKKAVIIGTAAAAIAVGGAVYYASSSSKGDIEKKGRKKDGRSKKKKTVSDPDGPILEERKPTVEDEQALIETEYTVDQIIALPEEERTRIASTLKAKGNDAYKQRNFDEAAKFYTRAIAMTPKSEPVFFSNRAACYINMSPPLYEKVVEDCDEALRLDSKYVKALNRRAVALEALERFSEALRDFTAATILNRFSDQSSSNAVERVLKEMSTREAKQTLASRAPRLPSFTFISAYFAAFRPRPLPTLPVNPSTGDNTLILALQALEAPNYPHAFTLVNEAIEQGISWDQGKAEALNLRGTFKFLTGDVEGAKDDLNESIRLVPSFTQSWVKIASVWMEQTDPAKAFECFDKAIEYNANDPDIYYHRGQVLFIMNQFKDAAENYTKSTELDDQFVFSHIQLAVAQYKSEQLASAMAQFRRTMKQFPQRNQGRYSDAVEKFDKATEIERTKPMPNVLPIVNKGLALYQWEQNIGAAEKCCNEALEIDPECDAAVATLAQLSLQQGKVEEAIKYFDKQVELARAEPELASVAQLEFAKNYPAMAAQMNSLAQMM
ncbi:TOM (translocase of outer membrane) complex component [Marasmius crinis-equi]|uniref:TOM (Translocase of outer membrane) complex component n=1 Tax=Marasmius crinis-equi TaxID=585013 RepID=A0ABR3FHI6_9AGAR